MSAPVLNGGPDDPHERAAEAAWERRNHPPVPVPLLDEEWPAWTDTPTQTAYYVEWPQDQRRRR